MTKVATNKERDDLGEKQPLWQLSIICSFKGKYLVCPIFPLCKIISNFIVCIYICSKEHNDLKKIVINICNCTVQEEVLLQYHFAICNKILQVILVDCLMVH